MTESVVNMILNDNNEFKNIKILQQKFFLTENSILKEEAVYNIDLMLKNRLSIESG